MFLLKVKELKIKSLCLLVADEKQSFWKAISDGVSCDLKS